jgi:hypothetical protein
LSEVVLAKMADSGLTPVSNADRLGKAPTEEADIARFNCKEFAHLVSESKEETVVEDEYYLSGRRLWLVHSGIVLYAPITLSSHLLTIL